ncbi:hypothetical protein GF374_02135 [Candidatus Woesearchaeota archaeon]|nr:hypothetical protein [Candidatus Woesearchaeota archaeon]
MTENTLDKQIENILISSGIPIFKSKYARDYEPNIKGAKSILFESVEGLTLMEHVKGYQYVDTITALSISGILGECWEIKGCGVEYNYETDKETEVEQSTIVISRNNHPRLLVGDYDVLQETYQKLIKVIKKSKE